MGRAIVLVLVVAYATALAWRPSTPAPTTPPAIEPATLRADPVRFSGSVPADWPAPRFSVLPDLRTIDASDHDHAIVGGALVDGDQVVHACLFRTTDGGTSWQPLGPARAGARVLAVHQAGARLWAVGHEDEREGGSLFALRSTDDGRSWASAPIDTRPYPAHRMRDGDLLFLDPDHGVLSGRFLGREDERARFVTSNGGLSWRFADARSAGDSARRDRDHITTADGWAWRLRDGIVERRGPDDHWWIPTGSQPMGAGPLGDLPYTAAR